MGRTVKLFFQNLPPQPRNSTHINGKILNDLARAFKDDIQERMSRTNLKDYFKDSEVIKLNLTVWTPRETYFTLEDKLSKTSIDFDAHKLFVDEISRYFGFNDGLIRKFEYEKRPIDGAWCFEVTLMEWSEAVCLKEITVIGIANSQGYQILN